MARTTKKSIEGELLPAKPGRKPLYKPHHVEELVILMKSGKTASQVAAEWGIARETLHRWIREKPELKEAYNVAKTANEAFLEELVQARALGSKKIDLKAVELLGRNCHGWGGDNKNASNQTINIENMQINNMSEEELDKQISMKLKELGIEDGQEQDEDSEA